MNKKEDVIKSEAEELLGQLDVGAEVAVSAEDNLFKVQIQTGEEAPLLIGRHGETLAAIERVLEAIAFKRCGEKTDLIVNVNDYRERQAERLAQIAENVAGRVKAEGQPVPLRSFSSYERKIIHEYISRTHPDLTSYSEGEGDERILMITVKEA